AVEGKAEFMPFAPHSFDTVVCTFTICSLKSPAEAISEIHRVLKPGGRLLFVEHGLSDHPSVAKWQNRLNGIQRVVADGCNLNRDIKGIVEAGGLTIESLENFYLPKGPKPMGYIYKGTAAKR
ncbi:MAG: class I SAM-dependent methyltransferase, partial [Bdellovibrionia bacterium]